MVDDFRDLRVWQEAIMEMTESIYRLTSRLPADERFGLTAQVRRAAVSVASCIAEGNARSSTRDYLRFLSMSAGSLAEIETQILIAQRLNYSAEQDAAKVLSSVHSVARQLQALKKALTAKLASDPQFPVPHSPFSA